MNGDTSKHQSGWAVVWTAMAAVGTLISALTIGWASTAGAVAIAAALIIGGYYSNFSETDPTSKPRRTPTHVITIATVSAAAGAGWIGWASLLGGQIAVLILVIAAASSPWAIRHLRALAAHKPPPSRNATPTQHRRRRPIAQPRANAQRPQDQQNPVSQRATHSQRPQTTTPAVPASPPPPIAPPQHLTDDELCHAWRTSYVHLQHLMDSPHRAATLTEQVNWVNWRQTCLDELQQRNTTGFHRWLIAGARPASNPSRYMKPVVAQPARNTPRAATP